LDAWLKSQQSLAEDEDAVNILAHVGDILEQGAIGKDALQKMQVYLEEILASRDSGLPNELTRLDELGGFLSGVASDGVLNDQEIEAMSTWLKANESVQDLWPASEIAGRLERLPEDGIVSDEEREDLLQAVTRIAAASVVGSSAAYEHAATEFWEEQVDSLTLAGATYCLTGDFVSGDGNTVDTRLRCHGADTKPNLNSDVNYLVIGTLASRDWLYTSHGRKIEKALLLKRQGAHITIITERTLLKYLA